MDAIGSHESTLGRRFLRGLNTLEGVTLFGMPVAAGRTPTFAISVEGVRPMKVAADLGEQGIFVWAGDYYAVEVMERLGVADDGGLVRIGFVHYNTVDEVDQVLEALDNLA